MRKNNLSSLWQRARRNSSETFRAVIFKNACTGILWIMVDLSGRNWEDISSTEGSYWKWLSWVWFLWWFSGSNRLVDFNFKEMLFKGKKAGFKSACRLACREPSFATVPALKRFQKYFWVLSFLKCAFLAWKMIDNLNGNAFLRKWIHHKWKLANFLENPFGK